MWLYIGQELWFLPVFFARFFLILLEEGRERETGIGYIERHWRKFRVCNQWTALWMLSELVKTYFCDCLILKSFKPLKWFFFGTVHRFILKTVHSWNSSVMKRFILETAHSWNGSFLKRFILVTVHPWNLIFETLHSWDSFFLKKIFIRIDALLNRFNFGSVRPWNILPISFLNSPILKRLSHFPF